MSLTVKQKSTTSTVYDVELLKLINLFEDTTKARVKEAFYFKDTLTFIVYEGDMFKALGKNLVNLHKIEKMLQKKIKIVEFSNDLKKFIINLIYPYKVQDVQIDDKIVTINDPDTKTKGLLIGAKAQNLRAYEAVVKKYFDIEEIKVI